jgi:hypothetical protein
LSDFWLPAASASSASFSSPSSSSSVAESFSFIFVFCFLFLFFFLGGSCRILFGRGRGGGTVRERILLVEAKMGLGEAGGEVVQHAGPRIYSCCNCRCHVSDHDDIISKCFQVLLLLLSSSSFPSSSSSFSSLGCSRWCFCFGAERKYVRAWSGCGKWEGECAIEDGTVAQFFFGGGVRGWKPRNFVFTDLWTRWVVR